MTTQNCSEFLENSYPRIDWLMSNSYYLDIIKNLYCGEDGEVFSLLRLLYVAFGTEDEKLGQTILSIIKHDFQHAKLLAKTLKMLGGNGKYFNSKNKVISSCCKHANERELAIEIKEKSVINYKIALKNIANTQIKMLLERIVKDEELHLKLLKNLK